MYRIIGADQKEYGPVSADQIRQWLAQGRASRQTQVKPDGAENWTALGDLPEFAVDFTPSTRSGPPPPPSQNTNAKTSGMAIASLVLGILGICGITGVVGLVLGIGALVRINKSQGRLSGGGLAIAGICLSALMLLLCLPVLAAMLIPALAKAKQRAQSIACLNHVKQLEIAVLMYANANGERFPQATNWCDAIQANVGSTGAYLCPTGNPDDRCHYALNSALAGVKSADFANPQTLVMLFEADGGWNQSGGKELLSQTRHYRSVVVGFADGHVERVPPSRLAQLRWDP